MGDGNPQPVQPAGQATPEDIEKNKTMAIVGYIIPILFFIPLLNDQTKNSPFARFHANQQLVLFIAYLAINIAASILPRIAWLTSLASLALFVLAILSLIGAAKGEMKPMPVFGRISILRKQGMPMNKTALQVIGAGGVALGVALGLWGRAHSPHMGFGEMMNKLDSYVLREPVYYTVMIIAALVCLGGAGLLFRSIGTKAPNIAGILSGGQSTHLDVIRKAKELLDSGAIDAAEYEKIKRAALDR